MKNKTTKIFFIASSGGHTAELLQLDTVINEFDSVFLTEKNSKKNCNFFKKTYTFPVTNRKEFLFIFKFIGLIFYSMYILIKEKPSCIITTGALLCYPACLLAKLFNIKIVYIESYARVNELSVTGKKVYNIADVFIVQRPELKEKYEKSLYLGTLMGEKV